ncbi:hypothetical protein ACQKNX_20075 [Lysinibacillus sp. NPDC093712]|uniref:hypothetical protein n=1 Tax=Lysinibacillus sp. NPDC093712 TaxID=3390579 RepID=UPI003D033E0F
MDDCIIVSIKPKYKRLLFSKEKIHEFRNVIPKKNVKYICVYETSPIKELSYVLVVDQPIVLPNMILEDTYGKERFNSGEMNCKIAYPINNIYEFNPISLEDLKSNFDFIIPQSFIYLDSIPKLKLYLNNVEVTNIW